MATDRFYFWRSYHEALMDLSSDDERGRFVRAMGEWAFEGVEPKFERGTPLSFAWLLVRDQLAESVRIGRENSENGRRGGRPKSTAKTTAKSGGKSGGKTPAKSAAKSERKGTEVNGNEPRSLRERSASRLRAGEARALAQEDSDEKWEGDST